MKPFNEKDTRKAGMSIGDLAMHGDVLIERIDELPNRFETFEKSKDNALAYGEATGHIHQLTGGEFDIRIDNENQSNRLFIVKEETILKHQEHAPVVLPPGHYKSRIQKEYDPFTKRIREVAD